MAHQSLARTVLEKTLELAAAQGGEVTADAVSNALGLATHQAHKQLLNTLSDLSLAGRVHRVRKGVYSPPPTPRQPEKREVMWRTLRMRRRVTIEDLVELAGVSCEYAREWLAALTHRGVVRKHQRPGLPATWQLIHDTVAMPEDDTKAAKLRQLRQRRKQELTQAIDQALKGLQTINEALSKARATITTMEEGEC